MLRRFPPVDHGGGFRSPVLGLQFWLRRSHFGADGRLRVRCRARIADVYFAESLTHVVGTAGGDGEDMEAGEDHSRVLHATSAGCCCHPAMLLLLLLLLLL